MRPIKLRLTAFGSYPGTEVVDFNALGGRGIFVVSGDTGTGKTTIFDAMCWALYGDMPGKNPGEVRSHHVADDVRTEVEFTFACGDEHYVVTRNPDQLRPRRGGTSLVKERADATLHRLTAGGTEAVATRAVDVKKRCTEIIGLDPEQFQRVVLLPQGEFSKFLLADTADREPLLSQLFGGAVFDAITEALRSNRDTLRQQVDIRDQHLAEQLNAARQNIARLASALTAELAAELDALDRDGLVQLAATLDGPLAELAEEVDRLGGEADRLVKDLVAAQESATRFDQAAEATTTLQQLEQQKPAVDAAAIAATQSSAARPVIAAADALDEAQAAAGDSNRRAEQWCAEIQRGFGSIGAEVDTANATGVIAALNDHLATVTAQRGAIHALQAARDGLDAAIKAQAQVAEKIQTTSDARDKAQTRVEWIDALLPEIQAAAIDVTALDGEITRSKARLDARSGLDEALVTVAEASIAAADATRRYNTVLNAFVSTQAPRLAAALVDGEACPVCGSEVHPSPAIHGHGEVVSYEDVERAGTEREREHRALSVAEDAVAELRGRLGSDAETPLADLRRRHDALLKERADAVAAGERVDQLSTERTKLAAEVSEADKGLAELNEKGRAADSARSKCDMALEEALAAAEGLDPREVERHSLVLEDLRPLCEGLEECLWKATSDASTLEERRRVLNEVLEASPFASVEAARGVLLAPEEEARRVQAKRDLDEKSTATQSELRLLAEQGIPDERPDLGAIGAAADAAKVKRDAGVQALQTASDASSYLADALKRHDDLIGESSCLRHRLDVAERVFRVCQAGGAGAPMSLKRWVLTRELDRVTSAANVHLHRMTGARYTLGRRDEPSDGRRLFGLDLEVLDAQTGRARSTSSLSGGEQFQASLALALGLADVVSHGGSSSGKRFEALFVDEGFGSLSADALDDAIEALHQLHATGRMVGVITHVEAMKERLHLGVEVMRKQDGPGSTLVVHP